MIAVQKKLQVFISSTYSDLKSERQAVVEAILRAGHIPAGMELFAAGSESQLEIIKRWIDSSDIYMILLGGRYGSIEPISNLSYTEIEYRYALSQNKPLFAIILSESYMKQKVKDHGTDIIELKSRDKLDSFTDVVKQKISRYANDTNEIRLAVLESMLDIQTRYSLKGWIREDQTPDLNELLTQITDLKQKNYQLENQLKVYDSGKSNKIGEYTFEELKDALEKVYIKVPNSLSSGKSIETNAYDLMLVFQRELSIGVDNKMGSNELDVFLYYSLSPHLRIFELVELVKVSNAQWTTFQTSKLGNKFISSANIKGERSKLSLTEKQNDEKINEAVTATEPNTEEIVKAPSPTKPRTYNKRSKK